MGACAAREESRTENMSEIKPALTAEEWERRTAVRLSASDEYTKFGEGYAVEVLYDSDGEEMQCGEVAIGTPESRHAVAALALYGQPFGFTHQELMYLDTFATSGLIRPIADKIRALLPPESAV